jgi:ABC-type cobalt transport system substrate-binding protein
MGQVGEPNFGNKLEEVWVPKDVGELEGLLLTIQNEPGKRILKHKIQQVVKEKEKRHNNRSSDWAQYIRNKWPKDIGP